MPAKGETWYGDKLNGDEGNFNMPVRFDVTDKYVGIVQFEETGKVTERILLTPKQAKALAEWIKSYC